MTQENTELTTRETKNKALTNQAVELITSAPNLSNQQIANQLGVSRTHLSNLMKNEYAQELLRRELHERKETIDTWINELYNTEPKNPSNQRFAAKLQTDIIKALSDKLYPTKTENTNINIDINLTKLQQTHLHHQEAIARLPPHMRQQYQTNLNQIRREWNHTNPQ